MESWAGNDYSPKNTDYAKHLIERIESAPQNDRVGVLSNELLREFQRGYPLVDLEYMLKSDDNDVVALLFGLQASWAKNPDLYFGV